MGVYENCKAKIKKKNKTEQQEEPVDPIKLASGDAVLHHTSKLPPSHNEILKKNSSLNAKEASKNVGPNHIAAQTFTFHELAAATRNFGADCLCREGGFGVYKGRLRSTNQDVAIRDLYVCERKEDREFLVEESKFGVLHHLHIVNLIGYCRDKFQGFLVYEYMPLGSLDYHLYKISPGKKLLDWSTRMKIAAGVAKGLEYLHDKANPPVIYRNLRCSNILLGEGYHPKLSDFSLAAYEYVIEDDDMCYEPMFPRTHEYRDPDYEMTGQLTLKSDVFSFGVLLLEIITGRKAFDWSRTERYLVKWTDSRWSNPSQIVDPMLQGQYPPRGLREALDLAARCVTYPDMRPSIAEVVIVLNKIASQNYDPDTQPV